MQQLEEQKPFDKFDLFPLDDNDDELIPLVKPIDLKIIIQDNKDNFKCMECGGDDFQSHFK